ncbi:hypothetical protein DID88_000219 [Monilinia fructigena]|uniref:Uncharacterized protein n=1 Tax=Monilinia fructigena TaxID=38457 RepID=A0A395IKS3_9HELO|nr:hypothetical protein DID88_000219 [Monilinia fructigena]
MTNRREDNLPDTILSDETLLPTILVSAPTSAPPSSRYNLRKRKRSNDDDMEGQRNSKIIRALLASLNKPASESIEHAMVAIPNIHQFEKETNNEIASNILTLLAATLVEVDTALPATEILGIKIPKTYIKKQWQTKSMRKTGKLQFKKK